MYISLIQNIIHPSLHIYQLSCFKFNDYQLSPFIFPAFWFVKMILSSILYKVRFLVFTRSHHPREQWSLGWCQLDIFHCGSMFNGYWYEGLCYLGFIIYKARTSNTNKFDDIFMIQETGGKAHLWHVFPFYQLSYNSMFISCNLSLESYTNQPRLNCSVLKPNPQLIHCIIQPLIIITHECGSLVLNAGIHGCSVIVNGNFVAIYRLCGSIWQL